MSESVTEAKEKSPYYLDSKKQKRWIIDTVSHFPIERRIRYYLLMRNHVGDGAFIDSGAAGLALDLDKLNANIILTLIALALQVEDGTRISKGA